MSGTSAALKSAQEPTIDVLLVEDNPGDARLVEKHLQKVDPRLLSGRVQLFRAHSLTEALEKIGAHRFDVLLVDLGLPESQGINTLRRIVAFNAQVPVVVLTGLQDKDLAFRAVEEGAEDFLHKGGLDGDRLARTLRHVIDRKQREQHWRAHMADIDRRLTLGTVASGVAHEINNPLSFIAGNVQYALALLRDQLANPDQLLKEGVIEGLVEALEDAMEGNRRVRDIVRDLSDLAGGSSADDLPAEQLSVEGPLQSSLTVARNHISDRATLVCDFQEVPQVWGNSSKLGQVFLNILVNAAHAIPPGDVDANEVRVATYMRDDEIVVEISDTGEGIPEDVRDSIFEPFYSTKPSGEGTGLGLAISQLIVRQFDGDIEFDSTVGEGTTFRVILKSAEQKLRESTEVEAIE